MEKQERKNRLKQDLNELKKSVSELKPKEIKFFLLGYCIAKKEEDIIYKICLLSGRNIIDEIDNFLK